MLGVKQKTLIDFMPKIMEGWKILKRIKKNKYGVKTAICQSCNIVYEYACVHNGSGKPFYRKIKVEKGSKDFILCRVCYEREVLNNWM